MNPAWEINKKTLARWRKLVHDNSNNPIVEHRQRLNLNHEGIDLSKPNLWRVFVFCQITTQQRSGPNTHVSRFLQSKKKALSYTACKRIYSNAALLRRGEKSLRRFLEEELKEAGIRRLSTIAKNLEKIFESLENGEWKTLHCHLKTLKENSKNEQELIVVQYLLTNTYPGLGPKQARNFIQQIGLSRYQILLDSRALKTLKKFGCTFVPSPTALVDETVYHFVQTGVQQVAATLKIHPCILDACMFSAAEKM